MRETTLIAMVIFAVFGYVIGINQANYEIYHSTKANCDILLNKRTGETWFNSDGYWELSSTKIEKKLKRGLAF